MSYKAFSAIKEHVEIETIKNLSHQEINEVFNKQAARIKELEAENEALKAGSERAIEMLNVAANYIEMHHPGSTIRYDEADCDGYCVANDCRIAAEQLSEGEQ